MIVLSPLSGILRPMLVGVGFAAFIPTPAANDYERGDEK